MTRSKNALMMSSCSLCSRDVLNTPIFGDKKLNDFFLIPTQQNTLFLSRDRQDVTVCNNSAGYMEVHTQFLDTHICEPAAVQSQCTDQSGFDVEEADAVISSTSARVWTLPTRSSSMMWVSSHRQNNGESARGPVGFNCLTERPDLPALSTDLDVTMYRQRYLEYTSSIA